MLLDVCSSAHESLIVTHHSVLTRIDIEIAGRAGRICCCNRSLEAFDVETGWMDTFIIWQSNRGLYQVLSKVQDDAGKACEGCHGDLT